MSGKNQPHNVNACPFYFPLENGRYEVKPGLYKFPHDFGQGMADRQVFQFDHTFAQYRAEKLAARAERLGKYYCRQGCAQEVESLISRFIIQRLVEDQPAKFQLEKAAKERILHCLPSQDVLSFDSEYRLMGTQTENGGSAEYVDSFDALACQIQEDLAVVQLQNDGVDRVTALHLCLPNHWSAEEKIGRSFRDVHQPVPGMTRMNLTAEQLMQAVIHKGPFVRFAWGIATDARLNHHPQPPSGIDAKDWQGRAFDPAQAQLYLRVERQTIHGFPAQGCALFTIRTYLYDIDTDNFAAEHRDRIASAIESMTEDSARYKGLEEDRGAILQWLIR